MAKHSVCICCLRGVCHGIFVSSTSDIISSIIVRCVFGWTSEFVCVCVQTCESFIGLLCALNVSQWCALNIFRIFMNDFNLVGMTPSIAWWLLWYGGRYVFFSNYRAFLKYPKLMRQPEINVVYRSSLGLVSDYGGRLYFWCFKEKYFLFLSFKSIQSSRHYKTLRAQWVPARTICFLLSFHLPFAAVNCFCFFFFFLSTVLFRSLALSLLTLCGVISDERTW